MRPAVNLSITDRYRLKELTLTKSMAVPTGRVMFCRGRKILNFADVAVLANVFQIPKGATEICVSAADHADIKEWIG